MQCEASRGGMGVDCEFWGGGNLCPNFIHSFFNSEMEGPAADAQSVRCCRRKLLPVVAICCCLAVAAACCCLRPLLPPSAVVAACSCCYQPKPKADRFGAASSLVLILAHRVHAACPHICPRLLFGVVCSFRVRRLPLGWANGWAEVLRPRGMGRASFPCFDTVFRLSAPVGVG